MVRNQNFLFLPKFTLNIFFFLSLNFVVFDVDRVMVKNVMASGLSTTQLEVTWTLPKYSCDAVGYRIYYVEEDGSGSQERSESLYDCLGSHFMKTKGSPLIAFLNMIAH